ncbi:MAG: GDSL-type esterase/lipase family protein [Bacteroidales bacterium]|nr:GDSL-type esterase/lipase family protein [Bacteroidales bacterium]
MSIKKSSIFILLLNFCIHIHGQSQFTQRYDTARIYKAMQKAQSGAPIVIGVIGGSITYGSFATTPAKRWTNLVTDWWKSKFPQSSVTLVNAGIGGTGSDIGVHRLRQDLLDYNPDFVVVEFSVNDGANELVAQTMEGLVRQVLHNTNYPGLMMLMLREQNGGTGYLAHKPIAFHYNIPCINYAEWIDAKVAQDTVPIANLYFEDGLHPVDLGMQYIANFVTDELDSIYKHLPITLIDIDSLSNIASPLYSDFYEHTEKYSHSTITPSENTGWNVSENGWNSNTIGATLSFDMNGKALSFLYTRHNSPERGRVEVWVDNGTHKYFDSYWTSTWGPALSFARIAENLPDTIHQVHFKIHNTHNYYSSGYNFEIFNLQKAGHYQSLITKLETTPYTNKLIVSPNPIKDNFSLHFYNDFSTLYEFSVTSLTGMKVVDWGKQWVEAGEISKQFSLDKGQLKQGVYLLHITRSNGTSCVKLVVR